MGQIFERRANSPEPESIDKTRILTDAARESALSEVTDLSAREKVERTIENRLVPFLVENRTIAEQLTSPRYRKHINDTQEYLNVALGAVICPDGRIVPSSLFDPVLGRINRRLAGKPDTRKTTYGLSLPNDTDIAASISTLVEERKRNGQNPHIVELVGPHIDSVHPVHGCGAAKAKLTEKGKPAQLAMQHGGMDAYFEELGSGIHAFDNLAARSGGKGSTMPMTHDSYSQGLILGYEPLSEQAPAPLREQLISMHQSGKIIMTELLDFEDRITAEAQKRGVGTSLNMRDPRRIADNNIVVGEIARTLTQQEEAQEYPWLPDTFRAYAPEAQRTIAYIAIRNCVYRQLGDIQPGNHSLRDHPEQLIQVGPIGSIYNVDTIPFFAKTSSPQLQTPELDGVKKLYGLSEGILPTLGVDFATEGRIVIATGRYDAEKYSDSKTAQAELERVASTVRNNAAQLQETFSDGLVSGDTIVLGMLHKSGSREVTHIVGPATTTSIA